MADVELDVTNLPPNDVSDNDTNMTLMSQDDYMDELLTYHIFPLHYEWVLIALNILVLFVGLMGNFLVCYVVYKNQVMQTVTNIFIVNLAVADFCVLLFCLPPTVAWDVTETWFLGNIPCKMILYFQTVSVSVSVLTLTAISVDRWYAICKPLEFKSTPTRAKVATIIIWILSIVLDFPEVIYLQSASYQFNRKDISTVFFTTCAPTWGVIEERIFVLAKFGLLFLLPLVFMAVAYTHIVQVLWRQELLEIGGRPRDNFHLRTLSKDIDRTTISLANEIQIRSRRKAAKMLVAVVTMFGLFYLPVHLISIARIFITMSNYEGNKVISQLSHLLIYANSAINPLIYNFMSGKFRREFRRAIFCIPGYYEESEPKLYYKTTTTRANRV